ncbi:transposase [Hyella patelloides LEGE 07179]|uniref:Transposase n=1 Tax=Hyella patelloides LEGE 07179 TaxID=945734 RepID=A0A563W007_9CYAN|nr:IS4 family transposase [Hyella patelloides]VEP16957.1 transposase [Hyella patelloides LEGE 07179]
MDFFSDHKSQIEKYLTKSQIITLQLLIWLLQVQKEVRIERLASCLPIPILYESRRKKIQRFLASSSLSLSLFWFPIIKSIVEQEFKRSNPLILVLDRTQWSDKNVFMISVMWRKRALPIYWLILSKKGSSNIREQIALIRPVLKLFSHYDVVILGDREFHGVELSYWLKEKNKKAKNPIYFAFREKGNIYIKRSSKNEVKLKDLKLTPGVKILYKNLKVTKQKGFGKFNILVYKKRDYRHHQAKENWFILTNLDSANEVIKLYKKRAGIEAMFRDYKSGGYNLEGSKANLIRLTNLILLIAIAYTSASLEGKSFKNQGHQKYITRLTEAQRKYRRHSDFRIGLYGQNWIIAWNFCFNLVEKLMIINRHKSNYYQQGLKVLSAIS